MSAPACPKCKTTWLPEALPAAAEKICHGCQTPFEVTFFPALTRPAAAVVQPEKLVIDGDASCFYHADKRAAIACSACGRFLCHLCDVTLGDRHLCPGCIETGRAKGRFTEFETSRILWGSAALTITVVPIILCFWITLVTAPAAIVLAIYGWKKPQSIVTTSRWQSWAAIIIATLEIAVWVTVFTLAATGAFN